jgi:hypothetical protein
MWKAGGHRPPAAEQKPAPMTKARDSQNAPPKGRKELKDPLHRYLLRRVRHIRCKDQWKIYKETHKDNI